ncbi:hypothetical protein ACFE04_013092 [Oxalis oulophora]
MGFHLHAIKNAKKMLQRSLSNGRSSDVPKGYLAVYVGEIQMKRVVIPISYLNHPEFQNLLIQSEEEFGFNHPMGGLTIPCTEDIFVFKENVEHIEPSYKAASGTGIKFYKFSVNKFPELENKPFRDLRKKIKRPEDFPLGRLFEL